MKLRYFLGALVLVVAFAAGASAQESEVSGGGGGGITAAPGSGTAGRVPQFASASSLADSKMTTSGTDSGTWTLYDNTAVTGVSQLYVRDGAGQASSPQLVLGTNGVGVGLSIYARPSTAYVDFRDGNAGSYINIVANGLYGGSGGWALEDSSNALVLSSGSKITWQSAANYYSGSPDIGLARSAAGILKITDGSTGQGGIGISDAATNTVTDALILRHATSGTAAASFGTGLLFQGEDAAGNMQDMASIDAVYTDASNGSEDTRFEFRGYVAGTEYKFASLGDADNSFTIYDTAGTARFKYTNANYALSVGGTSAIRIFGDGTNALVFPFTGNIYSDSYARTFISNPVLMRGQTVTLVDTTATTFCTITVPQDTAVGGLIEYTITFSSGSDDEIESGMLYFTATNEGGTELGNVGEVGTSIQTPAGVMTTDFTVATGTDTIEIQCDADSTALDVNPTITYRVHFNSGPGSFTGGTP